MRTVSWIAILLLVSAAAAADENRDSAEQWLEAHRNPDQKQYFGEPIDLSLKDADLVEVLRSFSEIGGFNLIVQPGISGKVTAQLEGVPWDQALEAILEINNLGMEVTGGKVSVEPRSASTVQLLAPETVEALARDRDGREITPPAAPPPPRTPL